jgi:hypothetical protein
MPRRKKMDEVGYLINSIKKAKSDEARAKKTRLEDEEKLCKLLDKPLDSKTGTTNIEAFGHTIKIVSRQNHTINSSILEEIAVENNLEDYLSTFFKWKPQLDKRAWDSADETERLPFTKAITTTIGKPSITITENIEV